MGFFSSSNGKINTLRTNVTTIYGFLVALDEPNDAPTFLSALTYGEAAILRFLTLGLSGRS